MKSVRFFKNIFIYVLIFILTSCAANQLTGSITVTNQTNDKTGENIHVGSVFIGTLFPGQTTTFYFYSEENDAKVQVGNFNVFPSDFNKVINLKFNYMYDLFMWYDDQSSTYYYSMGGTEVGGNGGEALR